MDIYFDNNNIGNICNSVGKAVRKFGKDNADCLFRRLEQIRAAENLAELQFVPGHYHRLKGDRSGQWACTIKGGLRLIFKPTEDGTVLLTEITEATIVEIVDYH